MAETIIRTGILAGKEYVLTRDNGDSRYFLQSEAVVATYVSRSYAATASYTQQNTMDVDNLNIQNLYLESFSNVSLLTSSNTIAVAPSSFYNTAIYDFTARSGSNIRLSNILAAKSGSNISYCESGVDIGNTSNLTMSVQLSASRIVLIADTGTISNLYTISGSVEYL